MEEAEESKERRQEGDPNPPLMRIARMAVPSLAVSVVRLVSFSLNATDKARY